MPNIGDRDARFKNGAKVKIYLGPKRFIGTGIVEEECEPTKEIDKYSYVVRVGDGAGTYFADELLEQRFEFGDIKKLALKLHEVGGKGFKAGEYWQAILNVGFNKWRSVKAGAWGYHDMVEWTRLEYGEFAAFCILLGKYHQQVTNGGHGQYWDNKYAGEDEEDFSLHEQMVGFFGQSGLTKIELGKKTYEVIKAFKVAFPGANDRWCDCGDDHEDDYPHVEDPSLDDKYYEFCHDWFPVFEDIVREEIDQALIEAKVAA